jgi:adenosylcobyric acid synthase
MKARTLMVQGTASSVGKSLLVAGLCRRFARQGVRVAPFKAQNMSNNAAVCPDGAEIGRAQALQALACGIEPSATMNPILLKPQGDSTSQVVVRGRALGAYSARDYQTRKRTWLPLVRECIEELRASYELVVIEGAGSPAEVNLRKNDIVNMRTAELAEAPVLLVGEIDRGGVFAQLIGTLALLRPAERARVRGLVVNKFRGDPTLFESGVRFLEQRTRRPVLGVVPYLRDLRLPEEDAATLVCAEPARAPDALRIDVVRHPRIANFTDFDALRAEPDVELRFIERPSDAHADALILPGTKSTIADLRELRKSGLAAHVERELARGAEVVGICGGYQMLGQAVHDPGGVESAPDSERGLGLLPVETEFRSQKRTVRARGVHGPSGLAVEGYEIHMGETRVHGAAPLLALEPDGRPDGCAHSSGRVWGTYLHGIFDAPEFRRHFLDGLRARRGMAPLGVAAAFSPTAELDRLAQCLEEHLDCGALERIVEAGA